MVMCPEADGENDSVGVGTVYRVGPCLGSAQKVASWG